MREAAVTARTIPIRLIRFQAYPAVLRMAIALLLACGIVTFGMGRIYKGYLFTLHQHDLSKFFIPIRIRVTLTVNCAAFNDLLKTLLTNSVNTIRY
jgi:hypothetical protein